MWNSLQNVDPHQHGVGVDLVELVEVAVHHDAFRQTVLVPGCQGEVIHQRDILFHTLVAAGDTGLL